MQYEVHLLLFDYYLYKKLVLSKEDAKIEIKGEKYEEDIKPGTSHSLKVNLENIGVLKATNVQVHYQFIDKFIFFFLLILFYH